MLCFKMNVLLCNKYKIKLQNLIINKHKSEKKYVIENFIIHI